MTARIIDISPPFRCFRVSHHASGRGADVLPFSTIVPIVSAPIRQDAGPSLIERWFQLYCETAAHFLPQLADKPNTVRETSTCEAVQMIP